MTVEGRTLNVYPDDHYYNYYNVAADIAVTSPGAASGTAYVTDEGVLTWFRDPWPGHAAASPEPDVGLRLADPPAAARVITNTMTCTPSVRHDLPAPR